MYVYIYMCVCVCVCVSIQSWYRSCSEEFCIMSSHRQKLQIFE